MTRSVYLYDGTFDGLLNAVALAIKSQAPVDAIFAENQYCPQLFDAPLHLETDSEQAIRLFSYLTSLKGPAAHMALNAFLSEEADIGIHLLEMVRQCLEKGARATARYSYDAIRYIAECARKVGREVHHYKGLIRFSMLRQGLQYAAFEPRTNIIAYCARHFEKRLHNQQWILHDTGRDLALFWDTQRLQPIEIDPDFTAHVRRHGLPPAVELDPEESYYRELWQSFHTAITNKGRENRRLQHQFIPRRYWKYLVEKE